MKTHEAVVLLLTALGLAILISLCSNSLRHEFPDYATRPDSEWVDESDRTADRCNAP